MKEKSGSTYSLPQDFYNASHSSNDSGFWGRLWNLKTPAKVKHFLWSASSECLPAKDHLRDRKVMVNELCPICNEVSESTLHCLTACTFAKRVSVVLVR